ncbi:Holliday junction resolvase RecU [Jeotgalibaca porci]|uniref:Holliday junction resolvase RecU n=1 Tax=Jeotgalibaca porci TaxID=1868793 RepID=UPI0035A04EAF
MVDVNQQKRVKSGSRFEALIERACEQYRKDGMAIIYKNSEPLKPNGKFGKGGVISAYYQKKSVPDFTGVLKGGQAIMFEAKHVSGKPSIPFSRLQEHQEQYLIDFEAMGAQSYVLIGFDMTDFYMIPIDDYLNFKANNGKKSLNKNEIEDYRIEKTTKGLDFI